MLLEYQASPDRYYADYFNHRVTVLDHTVVTRESLAPLIDWCTENFGGEFGSDMNPVGVWYLAGWGTCFLFDHENDALMFYMRFSGTT